MGRFKPRQRLALFVEVELLDFRVNKVARYVRHSFQKRAVSYESHALKLPMSSSYEPDM